MPVREPAKIWVNQVLVTIGLSAIGTYTLEKIGYHGYWNLLAFVAVIAVIATVFNKNPLNKLLMFLVLCVFSFCAVGFTGQILGYAD